MHIFIVCSKHMYPRVAEVKEQLEAAGHATVLPHSYHNPGAEDTQRTLGDTTHAEWKAEKLRRSIEVVADIDAVLVLNFEKNGSPNYIGGATFLEMYEAFRQHKKLFMYNPVPEGLLRDEVLGLQPIILRGDLSLVA
jgi:hypothetical protein